MELLILLLPFARGSSCFPRKAKDNVFLKFRVLLSFKIEHHQQHAFRPREVETPTGSFQEETGVF